MKQTKLHDCWKNKKNGLNAWCSIPSSVTAEILSGFDFESMLVARVIVQCEYDVICNQCRSCRSGSPTIYYND